MSCLFEFALLILGKKIESGSFIPPFLLHVTELRSIRNCEVQFCNSINVLHVSEIILSQLDLRQKQKALQHILSHPAGSNLLSSLVHTCT